MRKIQFKCTLIEDAILTLQPPQEGFYQSLNFIPGRCFRSIVANLSDEGLRVARNPQNRFGDAHIAHIQTINKEPLYWRTMHIPASMMYPKHWSIGHACYVYHFYNRKLDKSVENQRPQQMKQCRHGYYAFYGRTAYPAIIPHNSSNKSGYILNKQGIKQKMSSCFDSIRRGSQFLFEVETDCDDDATIIISLLDKKYHHIGRSKGSQYGSIFIEKQPFNQLQSCEQVVFNEKGEQIVIVYADSRLVFLNEDGQHTFRPSAEQLGIIGGEIDWSLTQVRTFSYMPWNSNRQTLEADISGFEKGSTFVIKSKKGCRPNSCESYVGIYNQDGFGHVIYNPDFLLAQEGTNGIAVYHISETHPLKSKPAKKKIKKSSLIKYINYVQRNDNDNNYIYRKVNEFLNINLSEFKPGPKTDQTITSQHWLSIRSIIMGIDQPINLERALFGEKNNGKYENGFLTQQSMKYKWTEKRVNMLLDFYKSFRESGKWQLIIKAFYILISELYIQTLVDPKKLVDLTNK